MEKYTPKNSQKQGNILNVFINGTNKQGVLRHIISILLGEPDGHSKTKGKLIVTPNPEIILRARKDRKLREILNSADISLPDGTGLIMADKYLRLHTPNNILLKYPVSLFQGLIVGFSVFVGRKWLFNDMERVAGREVFEEIVRFANKKGLNVVLLGDKSALKAKEKLILSYKKIQILALDGPWLGTDGKPLGGKQQEIEEEVIRKIREFSPDIVFVGFGAGKQERWTERNREKLGAKLYMVVGRTFEWVSGISKTSPEAVSSLGLEWLYRLITGSTNIKRIVNATIVFPLLVLQEKLEN